MTWSMLESLLQVYLTGVGIVFTAGLLVSFAACVGFFSKGFVARFKTEKKILKYAARVTLLCFAWPVVLSVLAVIGVWKLAMFLVEAAEVPELWMRVKK